MRVAVGEVGEQLAALVAERCGQDVERVGAGEVEAVEVNDLRIGPIRNHRRIELPLGEQLGQKALQPGAKFLRRQYLRHQRGFFQRRREEILAARLPRDRHVVVLAVIPARSFLD